jgi:hypothetical protein
VRLLGVTATNLINQPDQPYLIEDLERIERLNRAILGINNKFGEFTIKPASLLILRNVNASQGNLGFLASTRVTD